MAILHRVHRGLLWFLALLSPVTIGYWLWLGDPEPGRLAPQFGSSAAMDLLSILWVLVLLYVGLAFAVAPRFRATLVQRLSGLRERDEREAAVTGQATRATFLFSTALLLGALLLSVFSVTLKSGGSEPGALQIGLGASFELADYVEVVDTPDGGTRIHLGFLPGSLAPLLLAFLGVQLFVFRRHTRELRSPESEDEG